MAMQADEDFLTVLFWNVARKDLSNELGVLADEISATIIATCEADSLGLPTNGKSSDVWNEVEPTIPGNTAIRVFRRHSHIRMERILEHPRQRIVMIRVILEHVDFFLAVVHLATKVVSSSEHQTAEAILIASQLRDVERRFGHRRTIAIGDFNMNPFEPGMVTAAGFHAVMTRDIALEESRMVQGERYPFFYNPMWGFFGDRTPGPPGTHYFRNADQHVLFHHMLDQVLLRPELVSSAPAEVRIIEASGRKAYGDERGRPLSSLVSDHFLITLKIRIPRIR